MSLVSTMDWYSGSCGQNGLMRERAYRFLVFCLFFGFFRIGLRSLISSIRVRARGCSLSERRRVRFVSLVETRVRRKHHGNDKLLVFLFFSRKTRAIGCIDVLFLRSCKRRRACSTCSDFLVPFVSTATASERRHQQHQGLAFC